MGNYLFSEIKQAVKHWWVSLLVGILAIFVAVLVLVTPDTTLMALALLFEVAFIVA